MPGTTPRGGHVRTMSPAGLARLLERLTSDREAGAEAYERLRRALLKFFDWRGALNPDACADEAIDRLARKLEEGTTIADVDSYARGIARMILLEQRRMPTVASLDEHPDVAASPSASSDETDRRHHCLDRCLDDLPREHRSLVLEYYVGSGAAKIANRQRLAVALRVSENALRSRVQRVRERLEKCLQACLADSGDL